MDEKSLQLLKVMREQLGETHKSYRGRGGCGE